ncbi:MAG: S-methyl-5-thioribose-1-phosphate isomerase [Deltaproteobacteria bacterium]|nr:S-methyl-5-thioribose-1-phosphate isomerase [Deltaproteobacteria bacterium]
MNFKTIEWKNNTVVMIDQRKLPHHEEYVVCSDYAQVADAIRHMVIRGAPAIGVAAAMGVAIGALKIEAKNFDDFNRQIETICEALFKTRPTAVNLAWALERMKKIVHEIPPTPPLKKGGEGGILDSLKSRLVAEAQKILAEDIEVNRMMGRHGQTLFNTGDKVLTHCNAGALATGGFGTALGVIYSATEAGKKITVLADETRPFFQGSRLTAWELSKNNIPVTIITDNMAGWMMKKGEVSKVIVGADRIAANGDVANKIGTYSLAIVAQKHGIPFYVAAPLSTIDRSIDSGEKIPIEERPSREVTHVQEAPISPDGVAVRNPAFDVTPNELVTAIITEKGIARSPYTESLSRLFSELK